MKEMCKVDPSVLQLWFGELLWDGREAGRRVGSVHYASEGQSLEVIYIQTWTQWENLDKICCCTVFDQNVLDHFPGKTVLKKDKGLRKPSTLM